MARSHVGRLVALVALFALASSCDGGCGKSAPSATRPAPSATGLSPEVGPELRQKLTDALRAKGPGYRPRTRHLNADGSPKYTNRLILESSPYLLQHAHNPVNWFPWGDEAFAIARATGRPVFVSIGYSTCHWCHVMEEESFEDEEIAGYLNEHYIAIKVDREERPDVDSIYMSAVEMLTGSGGWPMSVWLTPDREPFFGGTYFPPRDGARGAGVGFLTLLRREYERFVAHPNDVAAEARSLASRIGPTPAESVASGLPGADVLDRAVSVARERNDPVWGGAKGAPKFPASFPIRLLLRQYARSGDAGARDMALSTLREMQKGGIYDHVGGGFHRYSTDPRWLVPHFEKMLYDQAELAVAYLEGFQVSGDPELRRVARETLDYVASDMTSPAGGFYSATDADSPAPGGKREEGWYFTWTPKEIEAALGAERARAVEAWFGVTSKGNVDGRSVLSTSRPREEVARTLALTPQKLDAVIAESLPLLRAARAKRPPPFRDEKVQASWNGLMIGAFARGAFVLDEPRYAELARRAADFALTKLRVQGTLRHSHHDGHASSSAFLDDYAFLAAGLIDLFELGHETRWLDAALELMNVIERDYVDSAHGGFFLTAASQEKLITREKPDYDGAVPCGNSVAAMTELRLAELTGDDAWRKRGERTLRAFGATLRSQPAELWEMALAADFRLRGAKQIAIVLPRARAPAASPLLDVLRSTFVPDRVLVVASEDELAGVLGKRIPWAADKPAKNGRARAYVCRRGACELPTSDPVVLRPQLSAD